MASSRAATVAEDLALDVLYEEIASTNSGQFIAFYEKVKPPKC